MGSGIQRSSILVGVLVLLHACGRTSVLDDEDLEASAGTGGASTAPLPGKGGRPGQPPAGTSKGGSTGEPAQGGAGGVPAFVEYGLVFGDAHHYELDDLAVAPGGNFAISAAAFDAGIDFGPPTTPLQAAGDWDSYAAKFATDGSPLWATSLGEELDDRARGIAFDGAGNLLTFGFTATPDSFGATLKKLDGLGNVSWERFFEHAEGIDVAVTSDGTIAATGNFVEYPVDLDGHVLSAEGSGSHTFVAKLDGGGNCLWARPIASYSSVPEAVAVDSTESLIVVGVFASEIDFGEGTIAGLGASELFIAKYDQSGALQFARTTYEASYKRVLAVALDAADNIVIAGGFDTNLDLGAGQLQGSNAFFVAKLDPDGNTLWSRAFEASGEAMAYALAVAPSGNLLVAGRFEGTLDLPLAIASAAHDAFVLELDPEGNFVWVRAIGGPGDQFAFAVETDAAGWVFTAGNFSEAIDFGEGAQGAVPGAQSNLFVAKLAP